MALAGVLNFFILILSFLKILSPIERIKVWETFFGTVVFWGNVELLLLFDLSPSLPLLSRSRLLSKLESVVKDPFLLRLISSFLELPIIDKTETDWSTKTGIPTVTFPTPILFHFFLDELDRAFEAHFLNFRYARYYHQIFVPIFLGKSKEFSAPRFMNLLNELGLFWKVMCIVPGGFPIDCSGGMILMNKEGEVKHIGWL